MTLRRSLVLAVLLAAPHALGAPPAGDSPIDISAVKAKLKVLHDGKQHYLALVPFELDGNFFYGDGKTFYLVRTSGGGSEGEVRFERTFWEPRVTAGYKSSFSFANRKYTLQCDTRTTEFTAVSDEEAKKLLDGAKFEPPRWKRQAYALARDQTGRYYYVDRMREPEGNKAFRLFAGLRGALKLQKMVNVVSDSEGDIFATKNGQLRLVLDKHESIWVAGKSQQKLISLPIEDNHVLIYTDLGVYAGEPLGTPCDDL
jgi:hypothetical protein